MNENILRRSAKLLVFTSPVVCFFQMMCYPFRLTKNGYQEFFHARSRY